jgi:hypothetical protein
MRKPCPLGQWAGESGRCNWCNAEIPPGRRRTWCRDACRRVWERNHVWRRARIYARKRANYRCSRPGCTAPRMDVEINHITPLYVWGVRHLAIGCWHHQDPWIGGAPDGVSLGGGLEACCGAHHQDLTNAQAAARAEARRAAKPPTSP